MTNTRNVLLAFGSNAAGAWGEPAGAIAHAFGELHRQGVTLDRISAIIMTEPMGPLPQAAYANAAAAGRTALPPQALMALLKRLEAAAGRQPGPRWGPRPLDIDILDYDGIILGWDAAHDPMQPAPLVLPHPELHKRSFVLEPLREIAPDWRHPVLGQDISHMLAALS